MTYVFLGTLSEIRTAGIKLKEFGQRVELTEAQAATTLEDGGLIAIPAAAFDALGFTAEELRKYAAPATHGRAPAEFLAKKKRALDALHELREAARAARAAALQTPANEPALPAEGE